ncbi:uncharacterized protein LOC121467569 [Drosophila elegans]|uniref:uncharacterized protein LOC121467569 n=1 Tax=Drosophila elegans TaxID=30023 RepID=UPI001BC8380C|nr:uncharacterized protein LOC121467569 [Drosophila elegans]
MTLVNSTAHQNRLSLPLLHELSLTNLHHIGALRERMTTGSFTTNAVIFFAAISLCFAAWLIHHHRTAKHSLKTRNNCDVEATGHRDGDHLKAGGVNTRNRNAENLPNCAPDTIAHKCARPN